MGKILEGAKFGDRFLCRDGRKAVFLYAWGKENELTAVLYVENHAMDDFNLDGQWQEGAETQYDIVSRCRADGWTPLPKEYEWLHEQVTTLRGMLAHYGDDIPMRHATENLIQAYERQMRELEGRQHTM